MSELEQQALESVRTYARLRARLRQARAELKPEYRIYFPLGSKIEMESKTMFGLAGFELRWQLRDQPDQPESSENQQTSIGVVCLYRKRQPFQIGDAIKSSRYPDTCGRITAETILTGWLPVYLVKTADGRQATILQDDAAAY